MDNNGSTENGVLAKERNELVGLGALGSALSVSLNVAKVTDMADLILRSTVGLAKGVKVGAGRSAAIGVVTKLVNVETTESIGIVALDIPRDGGRGLSRSLLKSNDTRDSRISSNNSDY
jgi:hypothetical protein